MEEAAPWDELMALAEPHCLKKEDNQSSAEVFIMLRTYFLQQWFNLSDSSAEEALVESPVLRRFTGIDLGLAAAPNEASIRSFRLMLEEHNLCGQLLSTLNSSLAAQGIRLMTEANGDAAISETPLPIEDGAEGSGAQMDRSEEVEQRHIVADPHRSLEIRLGVETPTYPSVKKELSVATEIDNPTYESRSVGSPALTGGSNNAASEFIYHAVPEAMDMSQREFKPRVKGKAQPSRLAASVLSIAVISPDIHRRTAAIIALDKCHSGPIREYVTYPPNLEDVPRTLNREFDVILVDLDSDPEYALNLVKSISINGLATVMVYSAKTDPDLLLNCMRAGAREFLSLPFVPGAMIEALVRASSLRATERPVKKPEGKLLVFLGAKGGSGVTTVASNYAVSLAEESKKKTLLIDLNLPLGDAAINLGIRAQHSIVDALVNASRLDSNFLSSLLVQHSSGLFVLAAPTELATTQVPDEAFDTLFDVARQEFDYVVVDAGSRLDLQRTHLFDASATIYLVTQVGIPELRNSNRLIARLAGSGNPKLEIVINRFDPRTMEIDEEHVTKALTRPAQWKIPNNYAAVRKMQNTATALTQDDSPISRAIQQMTRSVCGQQSALPEKKKGFSFFR